MFLKKTQAKIPSLITSFLMSLQACNPQVASFKAGNISALWSSIMRSFVFVFSELLLIFSCALDVPWQLQQALFAEFCNSTPGTKAPLWYESLEILLLTRRFWKFSSSGILRSDAFCLSAFSSHYTHPIIWDWQLQQLNNFTFLCVLQFPYWDWASKMSINLRDIIRYQQYFPLIEPSLLISVFYDVSSTSLFPSSFFLRFSHNFSSWCFFFQKRKGLFFLCQPHGQVFFTLELC